MANPSGNNHSLIADQQFPARPGHQIGPRHHKPRISSGIHDLPVATIARRPKISLIYSLLTGIGRRAVRPGLYPPPQSLSLLASAIYLSAVGRISPENHDSSSNQRITFTATVPLLLPNSLNATAAVPFFNGNGRMIRCLAWMAKEALQTRTQRIEVGSRFRSNSSFAATCRSRIQTYDFHRVKNRERRKKRT
jgi:hypothetical protein